MAKSRYNSVAIVLHWIIAAAVIGMIAVGLFMTNADMSKAQQYQLYQYHKATGVVVLWAVIARVLVRIFTRPPSLPDQISNSHKKAAKYGHYLLYAALILMPLSGWLMVSASPFGLPTFVFVDSIKWPHIPFVERNKTVESAAEWVHMIVAYTFIGLIVGHIGALVYHKRAHSVNLIKRMWWSK